MLLPLLAMATIFASAVGVAAVFWLTRNPTPIEIPSDVSGTSTGLSAPHDTSVPIKVGATDKSTANVLPHQFRTSWEMLQREIRESPRASWLNDKILQKSSIHVIWSNYARSHELTKFQREILFTLESLRSPLDKMRTKETGTFDELPADQSGLRRFVYAFPMYLTDAKRDRGFAVIKYGAHRTLGAFVPDDNLIWPKTEIFERPTWALSDLLSRVSRADECKVLCLRNYAISEILVQCVDFHDQLREEFDLQRVRQVDPPVSSQSGPTHFLPTLKKIEGHNWVFLFDLGDWRNLEAELQHSPEFPNGKLFNVAHGLDIPVGLGCNRYMLPWLLENERWKTIEGAIEKNIKRSEFRNQMNQMGIQIAGGKLDPIMLPATVNRLRLISNSPS